MSRITKSLVAHCPEWPVSIKLDDFFNSQEKKFKKLTFLKYIVKKQELLCYLIV